MRTLRAEHGFVGHGAEPVHRLCQSRGDREGVSRYGKSIIEIARDKKLLTEEEIAEILDPVRMTEPQYPLEAAKERDKAVTA